MPCFSCVCFKENVDRWGKRINGGRGYCERWDEIYWRGHECGQYAPTWYAPKTTDSSLKEPRNFGLFDIFKSSKKESASLSDTIDEIFDESYDDLDTDESYDFYDTYEDEETDEFLEDDYEDDLYEENCDDEGVPDDFLENEEIVAGYVAALNDALEFLDKTLFVRTYFEKYDFAVYNAEQIAVTTRVEGCREFAQGVVKDLTENREEKIKIFIDRCYSKGRLSSIKNELLSGDYDIPSELINYTVSLLD